MPRGRLIFPFTVELGLLDTAATAADPDGDGPLESGYDDVFREPIIRAPVGGGSQRGEMVRVERVERFLAQIEDDTAEALNMAASGNSPSSVVGLVFHFADLERAGAVTLANGKPSIKAPGARLISIRHPKTDALIESFEPGLYATQAKSMGFGLGPHRNLLLVIFQERDVSVQGTSS